MAVRYVYLDLGGKERRLRFGLSAWAAIEDHGYDLNKLFAETTKLSMKATALALWAALQEEEDPPSLKEVKTWVGMDNFKYVIEKLGEAIRLSAPPENPPVAAPQPA